MIYDCSIIIPSKNCLGFLKKALNSVQLQASDGLKLETIVVNDGSTDGTADYLLELQKSWPSLVVLTTKGVGVSAARNIALERAKSDYVAFLDADDLWWPEKLLKQLAFLRANPAVTFSFTDYIHFDEQGQMLGTCFEFWKIPQAVSGFDYTIYNNAESELLAINRVGMSCVVAKKEAVTQAGYFCTALNSSEDWDMWLKLSRQGPVAFSPAVTMSYLVRAGSITANKPKRIHALGEITDAYKNHPKSEFKSAHKKAEARINIARAEVLRDKKKFFQAAFLHSKAFVALKDKRTFKCAIRDIFSAFNIIKAQPT
jgi:glycosyltransferase involved in cell wall biosynthesis